MEEEIRNNSRVTEIAIELMNSSEQYLQARSPNGFPDDNFQIQRPQPKMHVIVPNSIIRFRYDSELKNRRLGKEEMIKIKFENFKGQATVLMHTVDTANKKAHPYELIGDKCQGGMYIGVETFNERNNYECSCKATLKIPRRNEYAETLQARKKLAETQGLWQNSMKLEDYWTANVSMRDCNDFCLNVEVRFPHQGQTLVQFEITQPISNARDGRDFEIYKIMPYTAPQKGFQNQSDYPVIILSDKSIVPKNVKIDIDDFDGWHEEVPASKIKIIKNCIEFAIPPYNPVNGSSTQSIKEVRITLYDTQKQLNTSVPFQYKMGDFYGLDSKKRKIDEHGGFKTLFDLQEKNIRDRKMAIPRKSHPSKPTVKSSPASAHPASTNFGAANFQQQNESCLSSFISENQIKQEKLDSLDFLDNINWSDHSTANEILPSQNESFLEQFKKANREMMQPNNNVNPSQFINQDYTCVSPAGSIHSVASPKPNAAQSPHQTMHMGPDPQSLANMQFMLNSRNGGDQLSCPSFSLDFLDEPKPTYSNTRNPQQMQQPPLSIPESLMNPNELNYPFQDYSFSDLETDTDSVNDQLAALTIDGSKVETTKKGEKIEKGKEDGKCLCEKDVPKSERAEDDIPQPSLVSFHTDRKLFSKKSECQKENSSQTEVKDDRKDDIPKGDNVKKNEIDKNNEVAVGSTHEILEVKRVESICSDTTSGYGSYKERSGSYSDVDTDSLNSCMSKRGSDPEAVPELREETRLGADEERMEEHQKAEETGDKDNVVADSESCSECCNKNCSQDNCSHSKGLRQDAKSNLKKENAGSS